MRGFGLSLLVPDRHYAVVARWIDDTTSGRLVFFRRARALRRRRGRAGRSLVRKVAMRGRQGLPFAAVGRRELARRSDQVCADARGRVPPGAPGAHPPRADQGLRESGTRRTTGTASRTAAATCWAGPTSGRGTRWRRSGSNSTGGRPVTAGGQSARDGTAGPAGARSGHRGAAQRALRRPRLAVRGDRRGGSGGRGADPAGGQRPAPRAEPAAGGRPREGTDQVAGRHRAVLEQRGSLGESIEKPSRLASTSSRRRRGQRR